MTQQSVPPVSRARVTTATDSFCTEVRRQLETKDYVGSVSCVKVEWLLTGDADDHRGPVLAAHRTPGR
jgi:hypothetical protein